ncbi:uncharacterized protein FOMMEDRAFT_161579 [Fomitiporia mediterranea MF3/22]|uniref:uncharacterized protein n=1 Tax=Fomitiporia mediterranea (strain MF3/22) TaxID=694068 RepID=UPI00044096B3|nr:uncharacterized protein FOMMEDRAFT_161579 [Fomitiporia mediterranea MF3/22]EJC98746.1 hypothetical protein FOMMEDRAFT_161579 [Fomitiporia mediterranea MF3/22]
MNEVQYPNFHKEVIDLIPGTVVPHWIHAFPFNVKGKRKDDLVIFGLGRNGQPSEVSFYENPRNLDFDEGIQDESVLSRWNKLPLHMLKQPSSCISADISGNGFNDLIVTCEYGDTLDTMDPYGGRICWLENFGTNEGDWICREIGRFPGVNIVKGWLGHFSTTFSPQLLAVVKSSRTDAYSPLIIFTRPPDVYKSKHWLVATALENVFSSVQDCLVSPGSGGALDNIIISSREGLSIAWYHARSWHHKPLECVNPPPNHLPGRLCAGRIGRDPVAYIVSTEANGGSILSVYNKDVPVRQRCEFRDIIWTRSVIYDFADGHDTHILDVLCEDLNGDGTDEIIVSVSSKGPNAGVYCFITKEDAIARYKLCDEPATKITTGRFALRNKLDLAILTHSNPCKAVLLYHSYVSSQIKPSVEDGSELIFNIPRVARTICETDVLDVAGYTISLVILPPNASFDVAPDGSEAVKVLHGLLGWIDAQSEVIERTRVACLPGCVTPMLVDSPEGHVRSGDDGAVFVRMRPSSSSVIDAAVGSSNDLRAVNKIPSYFPCNVCAFEFIWRAEQQGQSIRTTDNTTPRESSGNLFFPTKSLHNRYTPSDSAIVLHLPGFHVRFSSNPPSNSEINEDAHIAYVHFWASAPGTSTPFTNSVTSSITTPTIDAEQNPFQRSNNICSIRACLSNPSGEGGLVYCQDSLDWGSTPPNSFQIARATKLVLPIMYEHGTIWRSMNTTRGIGEEDGENVEDVIVVEYPWHSWVAGGRAGQKHAMKWNVWAAFDFPAFDQVDIPQRDEHGCIIC